MSQNHEPLPKFCELQSLPTELLLEILGQALAPEHFDTILIQQTPRRRQRLHGPREAFMITERERFTLRQVSKHFKELIDAHPTAPGVVSMDQTNWSQSKLSSLFPFSRIISGVHNLAAMRLLLDLNSTANFLIAARRLVFPQLVSLSIQVISSAATTRQFPGPMLHILPIISEAYPGLIDLELRNTESDHHDFLGWSSASSMLNLPKLQRLVLHSTPVSIDWIAIDRQNSWNLPSLRHLSVEPGPYSRVLDTVWQPLGTLLLTLSVRTSLYIGPTFWTIFPVLQELDIARSFPRDVLCESRPPALHPIRRVIIRGAWPSNPDDDYMDTVVGCLFKFTDRPSPVEWLICDDRSVNGLNRSQWQQYKETILLHAGYRTRPEVCEHVMEKWVTGEDRDEGNLHRLGLFERTLDLLRNGLAKGTQA